MAKINAINNKSAELTIDPGTSGDAFAQFSINSTGEFRIGVDDDASDAFKISQGSALGSNDTFIMTAAGENTMPLQPAFLAYLPSDDSNETGDNTLFTIGSTTALTEVFDQNADFNTNGTFTAPVTGRYQFTGGVEIEGLTSSHTLGIATLTTSNRTWRFERSNAWVIGATNGCQYCASILCDMDASDTATFDITIYSGTKVVDIVGTGTNAGTWFSGYLAV
jgi:hypothetical protein